MIVPPLPQPLRLDKFLIQQFPGTSRNYWRDHLTRLVRVNGRPAPKGLMVHGGERLEFLEPPPQGPFVLIPNADLKIPILYADADLIAVNKPPGVPCHPLAREETGTVANALVARFPELAQVGAEREAGLIHRLDNETSGVLLFARNPQAYAAFAEQNREGKFLKHYLAWVEGSIAGRGCWNEPIAHHPKNQKRMVVVTEGIKETGRPALTEYRNVLNTPHASLVLFRIHRGARHQIRIHCAHHGHSILGDKLYGSHTGEYSHHLLHARRIKLENPINGKTLMITAPLPSSFEPLNKDPGFIKTRHP